MNMTVSREFFARFNVPLRLPDLGPERNLYADFKTGQPINYTAPSQEEYADTFARLQVEWNKYEGLLWPTSSAFPAGDRVPEDLLLSWYEFAQKHHVEAATPRIWNTVANDPSKALMFDMLKAYDPSVLRGLMIPATNDNSLIFARITELLGKDVMYKSQIVSSTRTAKGVKVVVRKDDGSITIIKAKRMLVTIGPETMPRDVFDLDEREHTIFNSVTGNRYFSGIVTHPSLPPYDITNTIPAAVPANHLITPPVPFMQSFNFIGNSSSGPAYRVFVATPMSGTLEDGKNIVRDAVQKLINAGTIPTGSANETDFKTWDDHGLVYRHYSADQLRGDIIRQRNSLQGLRSTWYSGAAWASHNAAMVWNTTNTMIPRLLEGM
ncbi:hypothetical protein J1614_008213 [Plenodomus biglobosus]|nr:hypothetical protein J1614_008213 [Plenodomus biglobosus]